MKVLVGLFTTESNANVPGKNEITSYDLGFGEDCIRKLRVASVFEEEGIEMIPAVYASAGASGGGSPVPPLIILNRCFWNRFGSICMSWTVFICICTAPVK